MILINQHCSISFVIKKQYPCKFQSYSDITVCLYNNYVGQGKDAKYAQYQTLQFYERFLTNEQSNQLIPPCNSPIIRYHTLYVNDITVSKKFALEAFFENPGL